MKNVLIVIALCCSICLNAQVTGDSVSVNGLYRTFHFTRPANDIKNGTVVFILHGSGGDGLGMMKNTSKLQSVVKDENVFLVYPDGYRRYWNECRKASPAPANKENIDDISFFSSMIGYFVKKFEVNRGNVFVVGTSGGGHMVYKLAMESPENFKGYTAIIANLPDSTNLDCTAKNIAVPIMIINGTSDPINPYNGGPVIFKDKTNMGNVLSTDRTFHYWAQLARYDGQPSKENIPDTDPSDGKTIEKFTYSTKGKPAVVLLKIINGIHGYPNDIDVHVTAWEFFKQLKTN